MAARAWVPSLAEMGLVEVCGEIAQGLIGVAPLDEREADRQAVLDAFVEMVGGRLVDA